MKLAQPAGDRRELFVAVARLPEHRRGLIEPVQNLTVRLRRVGTPTQDDTRDFQRDQLVHLVDERLRVECRHRSGDRQQRQAAARTDPFRFETQYRALCLVDINLLRDLTQRQLELALGNCRRDRQAGINEPERILSARRNLPTFRGLHRVQTVALLAVLERVVDDSRRDRLQFASLSINLGRDLFASQRDGLSRGVGQRDVNGHVPRLSARHIGHPNVGNVNECQHLPVFRRRIGLRRLTVFQSLDLGLQLADPFEQHLERLGIGGRLVIAAGLLRIRIVLHAHGPRELQCR